MALTSISTLPAEPSAVFETAWHGISVTVLLPVSDWATAAAKEDLTFQGETKKKSSLFVAQSEDEKQPFPKVTNTSKALELTLILFRLDKKQRGITLPFFQEG